MNRHPLLSVLLIGFFIFMTCIKANADENRSDRPDMVIKISRIRQTLDVIDKMAAADVDQQAVAPSFLLRSILFGTDWIDPERPIVIGINYENMTAGAQPVMAALVPFVRENDDFHISYGAIAKTDYYLVPLPPGPDSTISTQMAYDLARAAEKKPDSLLSAKVAASQLLNKADVQIRKMIMGMDDNKLDLDSKLEAQNAASGDLTSEDIKNLMENLIHTARQIETFSMGMDLTESELIIVSDILALKGTDLSNLFTRTAASRFSRMGKYTPTHHINFKSAGYDIKGMMTFFNAVFGEFYKKIGLDLATIENMASHFTGEMAGGISLSESGMDVEMIAVLNDTEKSGTDFLESVYLPWIMDYGRQMAALYRQQDSGKKSPVRFTKTPKSTVSGEKVFGISCKVPVSVQGRTPDQFNVNFRTTVLDNLLITAPDDQRLEQLMAIARTLEKKPFTGPLMKMDIQLGAYLKSVRAMIPEAESGMEFNFSNPGRLVYTFDFEKGKLRNKYVVRTDDIRSIVSAFKLANTDTASENEYAGDRSFSQSSPTVLSNSKTGRKPARQKEDTAQFWLDKGLLYATYGNDAEAIKFYKKALQIEPENPKALFNIGISYSTLGKYDLAVFALNQAIFLAPNNGDYHYGLGWAYLLKGESAKAMEYIGTAADLGNADARKYLKKEP